MKVHPSLGYLCNVTFVGFTGIAFASYMVIRRISMLELISYRPFQEEWKSMQIEVFLITMVTTFALFTPTPLLTAFALLNTPPGGDQS